MSPKHFLISAALLIASLLPQSLLGAVIVDTTTPTALGFGGGLGLSDIRSAGQQSWTQSGTYTDVTVTIPLFSWNPGEIFHIDAFLTDETGSAASEPPIASGSFTGMTSQAFADIVDVSQSFEITFTGLTLGPGTYYITLRDTDTVEDGNLHGALWLFGGDTTVTSGVSLANMGYASDFTTTLDDAFPPASSFNAVVEPFGQISVGPAVFTAAGTETPEPRGTLAVVLFCGILVAARRHKVRL